jgi:trehalose synthase
VSDLGAAPVHFRTLDPARLAPVIGSQRLSALLDVAARIRERLGARRVVNVNSTAAGGGVAELLHVLLGYARGAGVDADWLVIRGDREFFATTKRIHNWLYGTPGDGGRLGAAERRAYERTLAANAETLFRDIGRGDVVIVHDPQPAGLVPMLVDRGARVVWRCHVGIDRSNEWTERAWDFLRRYVEPAHAHVFSRPTFAPSFISPETLAIIAPSIDPFSAKNAPLSPSRRTALLAGAGLVTARPVHGSRRLRRAEVLRAGHAPAAAVPLVVQVSRWDRLKDMGGVLQGFVEHVPAASDSHLLLAGPAFSGVADDPEAQSVWQETADLWRRLPKRDRERVHLALVPMVDPEENALVINALQRHATIVVQKSLAEGFGLTVAEAMWKSRAVVGSAVGGIADQLVDRVSGVLIDDPRDLESFGRALARLLREPDERRRLGRNARRRAATHFLPDRHLLDYARLLERVAA